MSELSENLFYGILLGLYLTIYPWIHPEAFQNEV